MRLDHDCWILKGGALIPVIKPPNTSEPERFDRFRAYGAMLALSMVTQQEGLMGTSFAVVLGLILGDEGFVLSAEYLRILNPEAAERLAVWYELPKDAPITKCWNISNTKAQNALVSLICDLDLDVSFLTTPHPLCTVDLQAQPSHISDTRTPAVHDVWTSTITQRVLFGSLYEICKTQEFKALKEGFDYKLEGDHDYEATLIRVSSSIVPRDTTIDRTADVRRHRCKSFSRPHVHAHARHLRHCMATLAVPDPD